MSTDEDIARQRADLAYHIAGVANEAVKVATGFGCTLDFSEASIEELERLLGELSGASLGEQQRENAAYLFSAYLLEVGRRAHGGYFQWWEKRDAPVLVVGDPVCRIGMLALDKVRGRLGGDAADDIPFFYAGFAARARLREAGDSATYV